MVQRSDDKGDKRSPGKSSETSASRDAESNAANVLRERIRQAGAATARASDHAPPANGLLVPNSSAPPMSPAAESSGVRTRPPEPRQTSITPPLFGTPRLTPGAMPVPWPAGSRKREHAATRVGIGPPELPSKRAPSDPLASTASGAAPVAQSPPSGLGWRTGTPADEESEDPAMRTTDKISLPVPVTESGPAPRGTHTTPRGIAPPPPDTWALSNARTQPMPRVRGQTKPGGSDPDERRRAELATTKKTQGLLRAPEPASPQLGRYSVHDVSTEYVDTGLPETPASEQTLPVRGAAVETAAHEAIVYDSEPLPAPEEQPEADTRPRRSTPKQRVGHRRSSRPEVGHARDRGTKRTDPGIRARTLRGNAGSSPLPAAKPQSSSPPPAARPSPRPASGSSDSASVVVDPSLTQPTPPMPAAKREVSSYVPLPRDREAYEAFLRSAAGEHGGSPRARPVWAQQETALIPRDALEPSPDFETDTSMRRGAWLKGVLGVLMIVVGGAVLWWVLQDEAPSSPRVTEVAASPAPVPPPGQATRAITLIATEPTGAELLLDGAVIGNTPLEVSRPASGEVLYLVRLRGFEHQMVRVTNATHEAIHITLLPAPGETSAPPAKTR